MKKDPKYIKRTAEADIKDSAKGFGVIAILGPRQSGKTTLAKHLFPEYTYLNLEKPSMRRWAQEDPEGFLSEHDNGFGLIIDEFQNVPDLLSSLQVVVDEHYRPGYFILTGSQNYLMNQAIGQSLAGRISIHTLLPLSVRELKDAKLLPSDALTLLHQGMYPSIYERDVSYEKWYNAYIHTYVERDVRLLSNVADLKQFQYFMQLCAGRIGQVVNLSSLGNDANVSDTTVRRWLSILESSYIVYLLRPYYRNLNKRLIKSPKIYFYDTGLACALLDISYDQLKTHYIRGGLFESFAISEFAKTSYNHGKTPRLYFWQDKVGHEVDCIIDKGEHGVPVEIKSGKTVNDTFFKGLNYWNELSGADPEQGYVVYSGDKNQKRRKGNVVSWKNVNSIVPD